MQIADREAMFTVCTSINNCYTETSETSLSTQHMVPTRSGNLKDRQSLNHIRPRRFIAAHDFSEPCNDQDPEMVIIAEGYHYDNTIFYKGFTPTGMLQTLVD